MSKLIIVLMRPAVRNKSQINQSDMIRSIRTGVAPRNYAFTTTKSALILVGKIKMTKHRCDNCSRRRAEDANNILSWIQIAHQKKRTSSELDL